MAVQKHDANIVFSVLLLAFNLVFFAAPAVANEIGQIKVAKEVRKVFEKSEGIVAIDDTVEDAHYGIEVLGLDIP